MAGPVRVVGRAGPPGGRPIPVRVIAGLVAALVVGVLIGAATAHRAGSTPRPLASQGSVAQPSRVVSGVPVGYPRTRAGAVAALLAKGTALADPRVLLDPLRRAEVLRIVATPAYAAMFEGAGARAMQAAESGPVGRGLRIGARTVYFAVPIAYRLLSYDGTVARVQGWGVSIVGNDAGVAPRALWATSVATARWVGGDWRIDSAHATNGPVPSSYPGQRPTRAVAFVDALDGLTQLRHAP